MVEGIEARRDQRFAVVFATVIGGASTSAYSRSYAVPLLLHVEVVHFNSAFVNIRVVVWTRFVVSLSTVLVNGDRGLFR